MAHNHSHHGTRIGEMLIERGVLSPAQVQRVLQAQRTSHHPFGRIASDMFGTDERELWRAWAAQVRRFLASVGPGEVACTDRALDCLPLSQARCWAVLPLRFDEGGMLLCATTPRALPDAMAHMQMNADHPVRFVLAAEEALPGWIEAAYGSASADAA